MRRFCFVMILVAALVVAGSSNKAFAAPNVSTGNTILSPYWQADADSYSFIAITAPSIRRSFSRAIVVSAISSGTTTTATTVTIEKGGTARFFIVKTNHSSLNSNLVTGANWLTITGIGHVVITTPYAASGATDLSVWGVVYFPTSFSGFAMEFIGDLGDSAAFDIAK